MATSKFDDLLIHLGTGKWNYFYFAVISWYCFFLPGQVLSIIFAVPSVEFTCKIPREEENVPIQDLVNSCSYVVNSSSLSEPETKACVEWEFDDSTYTKTLTSEYQLVCGKDFLRTMYHGIFMFGNVFGPAIAGVFSDKYGRKIVAVIGGVIFSLTASVLPFVGNITAIMIIRFIMGFANLPTGYILALEICEPKNRSFVGILLALPWALGTMAFGGVAYFVRDWHWLQCIMSVPLIILLPAIWLLDESPRWLIVRSYHERALEILNKAARWNQVKLPPQSELQNIMRDIQQESTLTSAKDSDNSLTESQRITTTQGSVSHDSKRTCFIKCGLCSTVHIRTITLVMPFCFCVSSLVFHGLTLSAKNFSINIFAYIVIGGLTEIPAYTLPAIIVAKYGRRIPLALCFLVCAISLLVLTIIPEDISWLIMLLAMIGKLSISSAGQMVYLYLSELYPTEYRLQGMGTAILAQRLGSIVAPLIVHILSPLSWWAPSVVMGVAALLASMVTLILPETLGAILPDTLGDLEDLFANKKRKKKNNGTVRGTAGEMAPMSA